MRGARTAARLKVALSRASQPQVLTPEGACIRRAISQKDLLAAYLFMREFRQSLGYPPPKPAAVWPDHRWNAGDFATFFAKAWPGVVASAGLVLDAPDWALPAEPGFPEIRQMRG